MAIDQKYGKIRAEKGDITHGLSSENPGIPLNQSDEPCIIFRAQDILSLAAIDGYIEAIINSDAGTDEFTDLLREVRKNFVEWQEINNDKIKLPD